MISTRRLSTEEFILRMEEKHGHEKFDYRKTTWISKRSPITITCKIHGDITGEARNILKSPWACQKCFQKFRIQSISYTPGEFFTKANIIWSNYYSYPENGFNGINAKLTVICPHHGKFEQRPQAHLNGFIGCKHCVQSGPELLIAQLLKERSITFEVEKKFSKCLDKALLPFDFYLPDYQICIEYDGIHHFEPIWGKERLELQKKHDKIKDDFCRDNLIGLVRISHFDNLPNKLLNFIPAFRNIRKNKSKEKQHGN